MDALLTSLLYAKSSQSGTYKATRSRISSLSITCSQVFPACSFHTTWHFLQLSWGREHKQASVLLIRIEMQSGTRNTWTTLHSSSGEKKGKVSVARSPVCAYGRSQCSLHCFRGAYCFLVLHNLLALWAWPFWPKRILIAGVVKAFDIWVPWYGTHSSFSASLWDFQPFWLHTRWKW